MTPFRRHALDQAGFCEKLGAPFTALVCRLLGERLDPASALGLRLDRWPGDPATDALVLRLAAGLHAAVLAGRAPDLAACYPPNPGPDAGRLWAAALPLLAAPDFARWLEIAPQTNEVGRSGPLAAGMLVVAAATRLPLRLLELGASAGLNLLPDRYDLRLGAVRTGTPGAPLVIAPRWTGPDPPAGRLSVADRAGVDLNPLPLAEGGRMLAYIWPDQPERLHRMRAALAIAAADPPAIVPGDAADFLESAPLLQPGAATLVFHSIAFQYFPPASRERIARRLEAAGATATPGAPLAWLRLEMADPVNPGLPELRLRLWPGDGDRLLGHAHPHGAFVQWSG